MTRPRLFAELCAGAAALSLALQGGAKCRPPVSRPGAKTGYSEAILGAAGLYRGQGADAYLWCEPEAGPRSVLACYPDPVKLREVEAVIRGWVGEDPRALWTRLREAMKGRELTVGEWLWMSPRTHPGGGGFLPADHVMMAGSRAGETFHRWLLDSPAREVSALASLRWPPVAIAEDARGVRVEDVAGWMVGSYLSFGATLGRGFKATAGGLWPDDPPDIANIRIPILNWPPVAIAPDARLIPPGGADLEGCVCYIDPPYENTTPYAHKLPRADVVTLARAWSDAGALVMISEAVPVEGLGAGWEAISIGHARRGQKRTWGGTQEWLTMNRAPVHRMAEQVSIFGTALAAHPNG